MGRKSVSVLNFGGGETQVLNSIGFTGEIVGRRTRARSSWRRSHPIGNTEMTLQSPDDFHIDEADENGFLFGSIQVGVRAKGVYG